MTEVGYGRTEGRKGSVTEVSYGRKEGRRECLFLFIQSLCAAVPNVLGGLLDGVPLPCSR